MVVATKAPKLKKTSGQKSYGKKVKTNPVQKRTIRKRSANGEKRNITWSINQAKIQEAYIELVTKFKRAPTLAEVGREVNLSMTTLKKHVDQLSFDPPKDLMRTLTPDVIMSIYKSARAGSSASQKLWLQVMEGFSEKIDLKDEVIIVTVGKQPKQS